MVDGTSWFSVRAARKWGGLSWALYLYEISVFRIFLRYPVPPFAKKRGGRASISQIHMVWYDTKLFLQDTSAALWGILLLE